MDCEETVGERVESAIAPYVGIGAVGVVVGIPALLLVAMVAPLVQKALGL